MQIQSPAGVRGRGDPTGASASRRLPGTPAESEAAWSGNQHSRLTQFPIKKDSAYAESFFITVLFE